MHAVNENSLHTLKHQAKGAQLRAAFSNYDMTGFGVFVMTILKCVGNTRGFAWFALGLLAGCGGSSTGTNAPPTASPAPPPTNEVPIISEALSCIDTPDANVGGNGDFHKVTLNSPSAMCNDGSPAVLYVRGADTIAGSGNWNLHFQGGAACVGPDCAQRWCDLSGRMSSLSTPPQSGFGGFLGRDDANLRDDANQVFFYYCSSDNYSGTRADVTIDATDDNPEYRLHFLGHEIVETALNDLQQGITSDDGQVTLPALGGTGLVTISGTSAGCVGVANNADRIAQRVKALGHETAVICDGSFGPDLPFLPEGGNRDNFVDLRSQFSALRQANQSPVLDESCQSLQTMEPWRCDLASYVLANHITESPMFVRMDLTDPTISGLYLAAGFTAQQFAETTRIALGSFLQTDGAEQSVGPKGVFGLSCRTHTGLLSGPEYFVTSVSLSATPTTLNQAIAQWLSGNTLAALDTVPATLSACAQ